MSLSASLAFWRGFPVWALLQAENREVTERVVPDGWQEAAWRAHGFKMAATLGRALPIRSAAARPGLNADALA